MPKEKGPFWKHVTVLNNENHNKSWRCKYCRNEYRGGVPRIKAHLAGITGYGITGCERVPSDVKAEAKEVLMPKKAKDSSDGGVSEERIQGDVRAAPTSTSYAPNVEGGNNLQSPQGMPSLQPRLRGRMEEMLPENRDLELNDATSYRSESSLPMSILPNEQLNPSAPLPSRNSQLLHSTLQNDLQGSISHVPIALDTDVSNIATANTPQHSSQPLQSDSQWVYGSDLSTLSALMDIDCSIDERFDPPLLILSDNMSTMGPSTLEGMPEGAPTTASSFQYGRTAVQHSNEPFPSCSEERETETNSFLLPDLMDGCSLTTTHVDLQFVEGEANIAGPSSSQAMVPPQCQSIPHQSTNLETQHQNPTVLSSPCPPPPPLVPDSSDGGVSEERIQGNVRAAPTSTSHAPNVEGGNNLQSPQGMPEGAPTTASSFQYGRTAVQHSNEPLPSCNEERETETSSFPLRELMDGRSLTATHVDLQSVEGEANMAGPSSSRASMPPQRQNVLHQSMNLMTAHQNPTVSSSSWGGPFTCHPPCIPSSSQAPINAPPRPAVPPCGIGLIGPSSVPEIDMNEGASMTSHPYTSNIFEENRGLKRKLEMLTGIAASIREEIEFGESLSLKKVRMEVVNLLTGVEKLINDRTEAAREDCLPPHQQVDVLMREAEDLRRRGKGLFEARETKVSKLLEGKMVGEAFQRNTAKILKYLVENQISRLGIHGMGGVGKTTIMEHIHNRLLEIANYGEVFWITVSQDVDTRSLQDKVCNALNKCKLEEEDAKKRAAMLYDCLIRRGKSTIIFDDVWEPFDLREVGIPDRADGIKLVLTTRSLDVCRQMYCQDEIKIEPLSQIEAENLFWEELGSNVALNSKTQEIVKSIVKECAGLPLAVITMARSMQGVTNEYEWKDALQKLRESDMGQTNMEKKVIMKLKFSFDGLDNHNVQKCFLSCALYPEDELMDKFKLIEFFIDEGLIGGLDTREKQYDRGLTILTKLENVCLLEAHGIEMKMHDLIRDMALHIMGATSLVKAGKRLTGIPPEEYWTDALEKVSLMDNDIGEFPLDVSPNCPKLSTLLLNGSLRRVSAIPDSFLKKLWGLEVLNLSGCGLTEIPNSISDLVNLRALLLRRCCKLRHIPCIGKLTCLRKLDARGCESLEEIKGLEKLVNLRYLDLWATRIKRLPKGTLGGLLKLQYLRVGPPNGEDITKLVALEALQCYCGDADDFNKCARAVGQSNARHYCLNMTCNQSLFEAQLNADIPFFDSRRYVGIHGWSHAIVSVGGECAGIFILIPQNVRQLHIGNWDGTTNLAGMGPLECLEHLTIAGGKNLPVLWGGQDEEVIDIHDPPATTPSLLPFPSLKKLVIYECPELKFLIGYGSKFSLPHLREILIRDCAEMVGIMATVTSPPPCHNPTFPSLEEIYVMECDKMKRVVESEWLPHFPNLRKIKVRNCANMEEIIGGPLPNMTVEEIPLESLQVRGCDKMRMLLTHELLIHLPHLQRIVVYNCKEMVEMISGAGQSQKDGSLISEAGRCQEGSVMTPVTNTSFRSSSSLPKLKSLDLDDLPRLKSICEVSVTCDSIEDMEVIHCPELKGIPWQLQLREIEGLPYIRVDDEETWKTLTWDRPDAQAVLQPYLRRVKDWRSRTAIELGTKREDFKRRFF